MSLAYRMSPQTEAAWREECEARRRELELTSGQQLALLKVRRSDLSREVAALIERGTARASADDYSELVNRGLAVRKTGSKYLIITYLGKIMADRIAKEAAKELGLHFFVTGQTRLEHTLACTCGWSHRFTASWHHVKSAQANWMARHLREVGAVKASVVTGCPPESVPTPSAEYTEVPVQ